MELEAIRVSKIDTAKQVLYILLSCAIHGRNGHKSRRETKKDVEKKNWEGN